MHELSVCIITYNEEKNIRRCLESVRDIADEIIVVDSYSEDKTKDICREYDIKFIENRFDGYIEQKNFILKFASYNYVLSIDADEALSKELKNSIANVKKNWISDGYSMNRLTNYCGKWVKHSGWYPDKKIRLFKKNKAKWGGINPHDKLIMKDGSSVSHLNGDLLHYSYYSIDDHLKQIENFTDISSKALFKTGKKSNLLKLYLSPVAKFVRDYLINFGFLDGKTGYTICRLSALANYRKYKKLMKLAKAAKYEKL